MASLFGKGGKQNIQAPDSEPSPLNLKGDKSEVWKKIKNPLPERQNGPSSNDIEVRGIGQVDFELTEPQRFADSQDSYSQGSYKSSGTFTKAKVDSVRDYADMQTTDGLKDEDIASLRKDGYKLSNLEKEFGIKHSNDFNNIIKVILISFSMIVGIAFAFIVGVIVWTSYKTNTVTEKGIISNFLQFIVEIIKIGLST